MRNFVDAQATTNDQISSLAKMMGIVHSEGKRTSQRVDVMEVERKKDSQRIDVVEAERETDSRRLEKVEEDVAELNTKLTYNPCARSLRDKFLSKLVYLFDNNVSGICCWCPVGFENKDGFHELIAISMPMMVGFYTKLGLDAAEVRSFFGSPSNFPRFSEKLQREEFLKIITKTPFRPFAVSKAEKPYSMAKNEERFVFTTMNAFQAVIKECLKRFPVHEKVVLKKYPQRAGQMYAFGVGAPATSPGYFPELGGMVLTDKDKRLVPAMGVRWWKELLTPTVEKVCGIDNEAPTFDDTAIGLVGVLKAKERQKQRVKAAKNKRYREKRRITLD